MSTFIPTTRAPKNRPTRIGSLASLTRKILALAFLSALGTGSFAQWAQQGPLPGNLYGNSMILGSSSTWANPGNARYSDDNFTYLSSGLPNQGDFGTYLYGSGFGFNIPLGANITGIELRVERSATSGAVADREVKLLKHGVVQNENRALADNWTADDSVIIYGGPNDLWANTWTPANVNESHFGFVLTVNRTDPTQQALMARVDQVTLTVYYTTTVLGVQTTGFTATPLQNTVSLNWQSLSETGDEQWEVQRSADMEHLTTVAEIASQGMGSHQYEISDAAPVAGMNYYRIKTTSTDGSQAFTEWVGVNVEGIEQMTVYPNPSVDGTFSIQLPASEETTHLTLLTAEGKVLWESNSQPGQLVLENATGSLSLASGVYLLRAETGVHTNLTRLIVQ